MEGPALSPLGVSSASRIDKVMLDCHVRRRKRFVDDWIGLEVVMIRAQNDVMRWEVKDKMNGMMPSPLLLMASRRLAKWRSGVCSLPPSRGTDAVQTPRLHERRCAWLASAQASSEIAHKGMNPAASTCGLVFVFQGEQPVCPSQRRAAMTFRVGEVPFRVTWSGTDPRQHKGGNTEVGAPSIEPAFLLCPPG